MEPSLEIAGLSPRTGGSNPHVRPVVLHDFAATGIAGLDSWSPFAMKLHRALVLAGVSYATERSLPASDLGVVAPVDRAWIDVGGRPVADVALVACLETLVPANDFRDDRMARLRRWAAFADRTLYGFVMAARWLDGKNWPLYREALFGRAPWIVRALLVPWLRRRVLHGLADDLGFEALASAEDTPIWEVFRGVLDELEAAAPRSGFWGGEARPTMADLAIFAQLEQLRTYVTAWQAREIAKRPALVDWLERVDDATRATPRLRVLYEAA